LQPACTDGGKTLQETIVHDPPLSDASYAKALKNATRDVSVYDNFETKMLLKATYLSPEFRKAFDTRYENLMGESRFSLGEADQKAGFIVSVFAPEEKKLDLNNQNLWTIIMMHGEQKFFPSVVRHLSEKERWQPFFPHLNRWSREYLILFDTPSVSLGAGLIAPSTLSLSVSNADARVLVNW